MAELMKAVTDAGGMAGATKKEGNKEFIFAYCAAAETRGKVRAITYDGDEETNPTAAAPTNLAGYQIIAVATLTTTAAGWQWYQTKGDCEALVEGTTDVAKDDFLEVLTTETSFKKDSTTRSVNSVCIAREAQASNSSVLTDVYMTGERVIVAAA